MIFKAKILVISFLFITSISNAFAFEIAPLTPEQIKEKVEADEVVKQDGLVYFAINGYEFEVAEKYMKSVGRNGATRRISTAQMHALLPNFEAYKEGVNDYEFFEERGWGRRISVYIYGNGTASPNERLIRENLYDDFLEKNYENISEAPDLEKYPDHSFKKSWDLYVWRNENNDAEIIFQCTKNVPSPGCKMVWIIDQPKNLYFSLSFHMKYLPVWKKIKERTELMIKNELTMEK